MRNYNLWPSDRATVEIQSANKKAAVNRANTIKLIDSIGGLKGNVLDIGTRNLFTSILEQEYSVTIDNTYGDLDEIFNCPDKKYDFIHYNNVIEHQFNPLFTLLEIKKKLKKGGIIILGMPLKPSWITSARCHFHEFNEYEYKLITQRAELVRVKEIKFHRQYSLKGLRSIIGSFYSRQVVAILKV